MGPTGEETLQPIASPAQLCSPLRSLTLLLARRIVPLASALGVAGIAVGQPAPASAPPDTLYGVVSFLDGNRVVTIHPGGGAVPLPGEAGIFQDPRLRCIGKALRYDDLPGLPRRLSLM